MSGPPYGASASPGFSKFKYEPLDLSSKKASIRLAVLLPGPASSTIRVTLAQKAFADRPKYDALSYTWGRPNIVKGIELNGTRVDVRENLWSALVHLRNATEGRVIWIDALCIDQNSLEEKNHQVKLMAYIYSRAETVLVWLGPAADASAIVTKEGDSSVPFTLDRPYKPEIISLCNRSYWDRV